MPEGFSVHSGFEREYVYIYIYIYPVPSINFGYNSFSSKFSSLRYDCLFKFSTSFLKDLNNLFFARIFTIH